MPTTSSTFNSEVWRSARLAIFTLTFLAVLDRGVHLGLSHFDKQVLSGQGIGKTNQFLQQRDDIKLAVVGSSRANHHVDVAQFASQPSYNMGMDGRKTLYATTLAKQLTKSKQIILVHLDPTELFENEYQGDDVLALRNLYFRVPEVASAV